MAIEMNKEEYIEFASKLLEDIQDDVKLTYINNNKPSTLGTVLITVSDDTESNRMDYIGEDSESFNLLSDYQKEEIGNVSEDEIFVMIVWKGLFAYFYLIKDEDDLMDLSTEMIPDNEEEEEKVLTYFFYNYIDGKEDLMDDETIYEEANSYIEACSKVLMNDIESGNQSPESLMTNVYFNIYKLLHKIDYVDSKGVVKPENMLQNLNEVEKFNFSFIGGTIMCKILDIIQSSSLKENEKIDFKLDIDNFILVANNVSKLEFDKNIK